MREKLAWLLALSLSMVGLTAYTALANSPDKGELVLNHVTVTSEPQRPAPVPQELEDLAGHVALIADENEDILGDVYYDAEAKSLAIGVKEANSDKALALLPDSKQLLVNYQEFSHAELMSQGEKVAESDSFLKENAFEIFTVPWTGGISISVHSAPTEEQARSIDAASSVPTVIAVADDLKLAPDTEDRLHDESAYEGGMRYGADYDNNNDNHVEGICSSGFGYHGDSNKWLLTAGHCFKNNTNITEMWTVSGGPDSFAKDVHAGHFGGRSTVDGNGSIHVNGADHGDLSMINNSAQNKDSSAKIWVGGVQTQDRLPVTGRIAPFVGQTGVCHNGQTTGQYCGLEVIATNGSVYYDHIIVGWVHEVDKSDTYGVGACGGEGDSGGPVFKKVGTNNDEIRAIGVHSGAGYASPPSTYCVEIFTGVEEAVQAWGGDINTQ